MADDWWKKRGSSLILLQRRHESLMYVCVHVLPEEFFVSMLVINNLSTVSNDYLHSFWLNSCYRGMLGMFIIILGIIRKVRNRCLFCVYVCTAETHKPSFCVKWSVEGNFYIYQNNILSKNILLTALIFFSFLIGISPFFFLIFFSIVRIIVLSKTYEFVKVLKAHYVKAVLMVRYNARKN